MRGSVPNIRLSIAKHHRHRLAIASHGHLLAAADEVGQILLYAELPYKGGHLLRWDLVGKATAHKGAVRPCM
jgi:hypothetical protein